MTTLQTLIAFLILVVFVIIVMALICILWHIIESEYKKAAITSIFAVVLTIIMLTGIVIAF